MPSLPTQLSRFLSSISLVAVAACSDDGGNTCGPDGAPGDGLVASNADVTLTYGSLSSLSGNDCPAADAPAGVISLSIEGKQVGGTGLVTFCVPRPDLLSAGRTLGGSSSGELRVIDFSGQADGCMYALDTTQPPTGTATGTGVCNNGTDAAGFALALTGTVNLRRTCGATVDTVALALSGTVAVTSRD